MEAPRTRTFAVNSYITRELDEVRAALASSFAPVNFDVRGDVTDFVANLALVELETLTIGRMSFGTQIKSHQSAMSFYTVDTPITGSNSLRQGQAPISYASPGRALVADPAAETLTDDWSPDCDCIIVTVDKAAVVRQLEILLGRPVRRRPVFASAFDVGSGRGRSWLKLVSWCLLDQSLPKGLLHHPMFAGRIEQSLVEGLLLASDHQYRAALEASPPVMPPAAVKRVMDMVCEQPAEHYDAARLAATAQVSLRTLQEAFQKHLGMSPMTYVREVRLQRVRQELCIAPPGTVTVADVARRWGFAHLGRFAHRYRARFGEAPSQTLMSV